jgi:hypothetical protein
VKGSATPPDCPPPCPPRQVLPQQHVQYKYCLYTDSRSRKPHSFTPRASRLTPHIFQQKSPLPPANSRRTQDSGWHTVQDTAAGPPCNFLPARHSSVLSLGPCRPLVFGRLYHRDPEWVGSRGSRGSPPPAPQKHPRPNPGPPPFAGPQASSAVGPRAVEVLG